MKIQQKLLKARNFIRETKISKSGKNTFSNYDYFTPEQVSSLVNKACSEFNLLPLFSLKSDEFGLYGEVVLQDIESDQTIITQMRTDVPSIKATNITQQYGGCETYTKRYMLMSLFDIADNKLDFDSDENQKKVLEMIKKCTTIEALQEIKNAYPNAYKKELTEQYNKITKKN